MGGPRFRSEVVQLWKTQTTCRTRTSFPMVNKEKLVFCSIIYKKIEKMKSFHLYHHIIYSPRRNNNGSKVQSKKFQMKNEYVQLEHTTMAVNQANT